MRYPPIHPRLFIENRKRLTGCLEQSSLAVVSSNDVLPTNADGTLPFRQNSDLFYLTGIEQPESILLLCPEAHDPDRREILFLRENTPQLALWEGPRLSKEQACRVSGIPRVHWLDEFDKIFRALLWETEHVYLNHNEHPRATVIIETREARFIKQCQEKYPLHRYRRLAPILHTLRARKSPAEVALIRQACAITEKGFRRILRFVRPGVTEYEVEAEFIREFLRQRAAGFAYPPIIAAGRNACILHYAENNETCRNGQLLLLDVAAEYSRYASDMTRTVPVNGRFSRRQKAVYNAVLRVLRQCIQLLKPGVLLKDYHEQVGLLMEQELIGLGLLKAAQVKKQDPKAPLYKRYFMHGTSHFLGLDVHDVGLTFQPIEEGMVFTCEPAIYIPDENLAVRLENNILISAQGNVDLMESIPIEAEEIEDLMNAGRRPAQRV